MTALPPCRQPAPGTDVDITSHEPSGGSVAQRLEIAGAQCGEELADQFFVACGHGA